MISEGILSINLNTWKVGLEVPRHFTVVSSDRNRGNKQNLKHMICRNSGVFYCEVDWALEMISQGDWGVLEILKRYFGIVLGNLLQMKLLKQENWTRWFQPFSVMGMQIITVRKTRISLECYELVRIKAVCCLSSQDREMGHWRNYSGSFWVCCPHRWRLTSGNRYLMVSFASQP